MEIKEAIDILLDTDLTCHGYSKKEVDEAGNMGAEALEKQIDDMWIPVSERLPKKSEIYLATFIENGNRYVERFYYSTICGWMMNLDWQDEGRIDKIIAWKPLPEPYKE